MENAIGVAAMISAEQSSTTCQMISLPLFVIRKTTISQALCDWQSGRRCQGA